jgi:hypothetical protein
VLTYIVTIKNILTNLNKLPLLKEKGKFSANLLHYYKEHPHHVFSTLLPLLMERVGVRQRKKSAYPYSYPHRIVISKPFCHYPDSFPIVVVANQSLNAIRDTLNVIPLFST